MAAEAGAVFQGTEVLRLGLDGRIDSVPLRAGSRELALGGDFDQRVPVAGGVVLRCRARSRRGGRLQVYRRPGFRTLLARVDEPIPANPYVVGRSGKIGDEV